jgi:hypothetical protein
MKKAKFIILQIVFILFVLPKTYAQICYTCPGNNNNVTGTAASAFGNNNDISGSYSSALGSGNNITSTYSFVAGSFSTVKSLHSYIIGTSSTVNPGSTESYIFGSGSNAGNTKVMLIGHRLQSSAGSQIILGSGPIGGGFLTCNKMHSLAVGFKSTYPTFFVSESPASDKTGKVGIGNNTDPLAKLHIRADAAEDATMLLEATGKEKISSFLMAGGQAVIGTTSNSHSLSFVTGNTNTRMIINGLNGYIGIGTSTPNTMLHVTEDVTIEGLSNPKGDQIVTTDRNGKLMLITANASGDNLGNHIATSNLAMGEYSLRNEQGGYQLRDDRTRYNPGIVFDLDNSMVLETGKKAVFTAVAATNNAAGLWVANWACGGYGLVLNADNRTGGIYYDNNAPKISIGLNSSKVGIGLIPPSDGAFRLYVEGGILAEEVKVMLKSAWPDYVFTADHKLPGINEVADFITANGHLPGVPSAATVAADGINLGQMNALLLTKIEELTLYVIELQRQLDEIKK